jgi:hypothetical protein
MNVPSFTAEVSLCKSRNHYRLIAGGIQTSDGEAVTPQQYNPIVECTTNRSCWGVVLMARDHCQRWDGSSFSSLWYADGVCFGLFTESFEFEF